MTIRYLDLVNGNDANDGTTFALRKKTMASATSGLVYTDTVKVMASPEPTSTGQNAAFTYSSDTITLTSAVTANIDTCETAWTASTNVTATAQSTIQREGTNAASLVVASAFTTGLIAYHALGAAMDFSAYEQVSFLIRQSGKYADLAASILSFQLCSDTAGAVPVHSFTLPLLADQSWTALVFDNAAALGNSIQSIALYALLDPGSVTIAIDNVIACKARASADSLTHHSLISKNTGIEPWMAIDSINGTTIKLAGGYQQIASRAGYAPKYWGTTATQTLYKREPIVVTACSSGNNAAMIECGWDRNAMTDQSGQTFVRLVSPGVSTNSALLNFNTLASGTVNKWYSVNASGKAAAFFQGWTLGEFGAIACGAGVYTYQTAWITGLSSATRYFVHCLSGLNNSNASPGEGDTRLRLDYLWGAYNGSSTNAAIFDSSTSACGTHFVQVLDAQIRQFFTAIGCQPNSLGMFNHVAFCNCDISDLDRLTYSGIEDIQFIDCTITNQPESSQVYSIIKKIRTNGDPTQNSTAFGAYKGNGSVASATDQRHTVSDSAWKVTLSTNVSFSNPLSFPLAKIACVANEQRTIKVWGYRANANGLMRLRVKGGFAPGIPDDLIAILPAGEAAWIQVALQFTPTQQCVVEVFAEFGGSSGYPLWFDDLEVT